ATRAAAPGRAPRAGGARPARARSRCLLPLQVLVQLVAGRQVELAQQRPAARQMPERPVAVGAVEDHDPPTAALAGAPVAVDGGEDEAGAAAREGRRDTVGAEPRALVLAAGAAPGAGRETQHQRPPPWSSSRPEDDPEYALEIRLHKSSSG